jgi:hypothetical protein
MRAAGTSEITGRDDAGGALVPPIPEMLTVLA